MRPPGHSRVAKQMPDASAVFDTMAYGIGSYLPGTSSDSDGSHPKCSFFFQEGLDHQGQSLVQVILVRESEDNSQT